MESLSLVIPTLHEAETIGAVIREIPAASRLDIIFANGGSTDGTQRTAPRGECTGSQPSSLRNWDALRPSRRRNRLRKVTASE
jgi:hypothetical protein